MNFKLTRLKVIISIVVIIAWYIFINFGYPSHVYCKTCQYIDINSCPEVFTLNVIPLTCQCGCPLPTSISKIIRDLIIIFIPAILLYIIWSIFEKEKKGVNKRK